MDGRLLRIYMLGKCETKMEDHGHGPTSSRCMSQKNVYVRFCVV
jgi:hypothetical protein